MSLSAAKATFGLTALFTSDRPGVDWRERIGGTQENVSLPDAEGNMEVTATLGNTGDVLSIDTETSSVSVTGSGEQAQSTLTLSGNAVADETVTIGTTVYTWKATVSTTAYQVKIGATKEDSLDNLAAAINAGAGSGTVYGSFTTAHPSVEAVHSEGSATMPVYGAAVGTSYNTIATTETMTNGSWGAATLTGGVNASTVERIGPGMDGGVQIHAEVIDAFLIKCTAGSATIARGTETWPPLGPGGVLLFASPESTQSGVSVSIDITAASQDTALSVVILGHNTP